MSGASSSPDMLPRPYSETEWSAAFARKPRPGFCFGGEAFFSDFPAPVAKTAKERRCFLLLSCAHRVALVDDSALLHAEGSGSPAWSVPGAWLIEWVPANTNVMFRMEGYENNRNGAINGQSLER